MAMDVDWNVEYEPNAYEDAPATGLLATHCLICGRDLLDAESIERGIGPICADKAGWDDASLPPSAAGIEKALSTAPESLREVVAPHVDDPRKASNVATAQAAMAVQRGGKEAQHVIGSVIELTAALGYPSLSERIKQRFVADEHEKGSGIRIQRVPGGRYAIFTPYSDKFVALMRNVPGRQFARQPAPHNSVPEASWLQALNALVAVWPGKLALDWEGQVMLLPSEPLPLPAPETSPAGAPTSATGEEPPKPQERVEKGMHVKLNDGTVMEVGWVSPDGTRIGVRKGPYGRMDAFLGTNEVKVSAPKPSEVQAVASETQETPKATRDLPVNLFPYQREGAIWLDTRGSGLLAYDMGLGKCQLPGTLVATSRGPARIEELWNSLCARRTLRDAENGEWRELETPLSVPSYDGTVRTLGSVHRLYREHVATSTARITLDDGAVIRCTLLHKLLTVNGWVEAGRLTTGVRVAVAAATPCDAPVPMRRELAELIAWQLGEGHETSKTNAVFTNTDSEMLERVRACAAALGVVLPLARRSSVNRRADLRVISMGSLHRLLGAAGFPWGTKSAERRIPEPVLAADAEAKRAFLRAFFEAEGSCSRSNRVVEIMSASERLMRELSMLLREFGIWLRISSKRARATNSRTPTWRTYWRGIVSGNSLEQFAAEVGFLSARKTALLIACVGCTRNTNVEGVPLADVAQQVKASGISLRSVGLRGWYAQGGGTSRAHARHLSERLAKAGLDAVATTVAQRASEAVHWATVKTVERETYAGYVYDLCVDETHSYVAEGVIVHNTATSIAVIDPPCVVVCPASLRVNWVRELNTWRRDLTVASIGVAQVRGRAVKASTKIDEEQLKADVVVINYDILKGANLEALIARGCKTLICDESHLCKELKLKWDRENKRMVPGAGSQRAGHVWQLAQHAARRILLTGTPIKNYVYEIWAQLQIVAPREFPKFHDFCVRYCGAQKTRFGWDYKGRTDSEELNKLITGKYMLRKTKDELKAMGMLPEKSRNTKEITLSEDAAKEYERAAREFLDWVLDHGGREAALRAAKAEALTRLTSLRRLAAIGKAEAFIEEVMEHHDSTKRPLVVFGWHREALETIIVALREAGLKVGQILGGDSATARQEAIDAFQEGTPKEAPVEQREFLDVIVCSIQAAGVGLTLTRGREVYFIERAWSPADLVQAEDRAYRIGQKNDVTITYYDAPGTIDSYMGELLVNKASTFAAVIDGQALDEDDAVASVLGRMFEAAEASGGRGHSRGRRPNAPAGFDINDFDWAQPSLL